MTEQRSQLRLMAMNYLARREQAYRELAEKIKGRVPDLDSELLHSVLGELVEDGLQDDKRYAEMLANSRSGRGYGPVRIHMEMSQKGLPESLIQQVMDELELDWFALARQQCEKKYSAADLEDWKTRGKAGQFLQRRGFTSEQVRAAINGDEWE